MGPNGMNKLVVNHLNKIIVTSDCATLVKEVKTAVERMWRSGARL